jgi:predicted DNA-binding transcriptional regulator AlpA
MAKKTSVYSRRPTGRSKKPRVDLIDFDDLPATARASLPVVCKLWDISPATAWRRVGAGLIPKPIKEGGSTRWLVGELRNALGQKGGAR